MRVDDLYDVFKRNLDRLDDIVIDIMVEDLDDFRSAYWEILNRTPQTLFPYLIQLGGKTIGTIEVSIERNGAARIGYLIDADYEGKGIIIHHLKQIASTLDHPIEARIHEGNERSMSVAKRLGLVRDDESYSVEHYIWRQPV